ncbi:hypothetical protein ACJX0J_005037, partial [Zea mays]
INHLDLKIWKSKSLSESIEIRKKKGYVATLLKEKRIGVPEEINASHNRISIYLHYRQIGAQPTRTNFERGSLIDGSLYCHSILGISILIVRFSYEWTLYFFFLEILIILDYGLKRDYIDKRLTT